LRRVIWGAPSFWMERFPLYWGIERGFFADRGIDLRVWYAHGGPELARAVADGRVHIGEMGLPPFLAALQGGLQARIVGSSVFQRLDHYLAARPGVAGTAHLAGCRIGILSTGSCDTYFIRRMLRAHGIDPDRDVWLVPLGGDYGKPEVFESGRVDAAFVVEPQLSLGEHRGLWRVIDRVADYYPRYQWGIILAEQGWLRRETELAAGLMDAFRRSCRSIAECPADTIALGSRVFDIPPPVFETALMRDLPRWQTEGRVDSSGLREALKVQADLGPLPPSLRLDGLLHPL